MTRSIRGIRDTIPGGHVLGRLGSAAGPTTIIPIQGNFTSPGYVAQTTVQIGQAAGGDLTGTYPNPTVAKLRGTLLNTVAPTLNQIPVYDGTEITWTTKGFVPAGGTTGQVLTKTSGTDYDTEWTTAVSGGLNPMMTASMRF